MGEIKIGQIYRHFKGNYYVVENIAHDSETQEEFVVYRPLYKRQDDKNLWIRPVSMFLSKISERSDNLTGQITRFSLCEKFSENFIE